MTCPDCAGTGWIPPEMTEEHPRQSACMRCAAPKAQQNPVTPWDTFAAAALAEMVRRTGATSPAVTAKFAAEMADAMMAERAKR